MFLENILGIKFEIWLALGVALMVFLINHFLKNKRKNYPPGPKGWPIVGFLPSLNDHVHLQFIELSRKYGEVFSLRLGSENVIVLNGTASIREAFSKTEFLGRPSNGAFSLLGNTSPFFSHDMALWQEQRRFVVSSMKDLGLGKSKVEEHLQDEISHFLNKLKTNNGKPLNLSKILTPSISNNICTLAFGKRYDYEDSERKTLDDNLDETAKVIGQAALHIFLPWIRQIPFIQKWLNIERGVRAYKDVESLFYKKIDEHKKNLDEKNIADFIDAYLVEMNTRKEKGGTTLTRTALCGTIADLFGAGTETIRTSLTWCWYTMAGFPEVQNRVQEEIMEVLGPDRASVYEDQKQMPFTHAVILEVMRWKTPLPLNILRSTLTDTKVADYDIPKDTTIMANFWAVHHDAKNWEDPNSFQAERFLSADKKSVIKSQHYMPFSIGRRACPGEVMAYMELFLYFVSVLQKFNVRLPEGVKATFEGDLTITFKSKLQTFCFIPKE